MRYVIIDTAARPAYHKRIHRQSDKRHKRRPPTVSVNAQRGRGFEARPPYPLEN